MARTDPDRHRHLRRLGSLYGKDYYVRQYRDMKIIPNVELIGPRLVEFATACGKALARAHARTGDPLAIDAYIGKGGGFDAAIGQFARLYAEQDERDHAHLVASIARGAMARPSSACAHTVRRGADARHPQPAGLSSPDLSVDGRCPRALALQSPRRA